MAIKVLAEKVLEVSKSTPKYERADATGGDSPASFTEKHYLPKGSIPAGVTHIKCRYYYEDES